MSARSPQQTLLPLLALSTVLGCTPFDIDNEPPVADAGDDRSLGGPTEVTLDGSESFDPDGTVVLWEWRYTGEIPGEESTGEDGGVELTWEEKLLRPLPDFCVPPEPEEKAAIPARYCPLEADSDPAKATVFLEAGSYRFTLFVTDDEGAVAADTVELRIGR